MELIDKIIRSSETRGIPIMVYTEKEKTLVEKRAIKIKADIPPLVMSRDVYGVKNKDCPSKVIVCQY